MRHSHVSPIRLTMIDAPPVDSEPVRIMMNSDQLAKTEPSGKPSKLRAIAAEVPVNGEPLRFEKTPHDPRLIPVRIANRSVCRASAGRGAAGCRLSAREERALAKRIKAGDPAAYEHLILANLALVLRAVGDFRRPGIPRDDLIQEGNLGLIRAARTFNPSAHATRFATYASFWIRASLLRAVVANGSLIQVPERSQLLRLRYQRAINKLESNRGVRLGWTSDEALSVDEIAQHLGIPIKRLKRRSPRALTCPSMSRRASHC